MSETRLRQLAVPMMHEQLGTALSSPASLATVELSETSDFDQLHDLVDSLIRAAERSSSHAEWDRILVEPVHRTLLSLPKRTALSFEFWQWLAVCEFPRLVWYRWLGEIPEDTSAAVVSWSVAERFLGSRNGVRSLRAFSRHSLARLWWCADTLYTTDDNYELAIKALSSQDLFQAVFERDLGLYPSAARACIRMLAGEPATVFRKQTRKLNHILTTVALESLDESSICELLVS